MTHFDASLLHDLTTAAHAAADAAAKVTLSQFRKSDLDIDNKQQAGFDPVTQADRDAELAIRDVLAQHRPDDAILGEEFGTQSGTSGLTWVLDPIDGTRGYIAGTPTWGTLISVGDAQGPILGLIDQPYTAERFFGVAGDPRWIGPHGGGALATRSRSLAQATLFTTFPEVGTPQDRAGFEAIAPLCRLVRYGMDCYAYALLALGQIDLVIEAGLQQYDIHAPCAVIGHSGGIVTDWQGGPAWRGGQVLAAGTGELHAEVLELLKPYAG